MSGVEKKGTERDVKWSRMLGASVLVATSVLLFGCQQTEMPRTAGAISQAVSQSTEDEECDSGVLAEATSTRDLQQTIEKAHRVVGLNRSSLASLQRDRRWQESEQHEHLRQAIVDTKGQISHGEDTIDAAECQLAAIAQK